MNNLTDPKLLSGSVYTHTHTHTHTHNNTGLHHLKSELVACGLLQFSARLSSPRGEGFSCTFTCTEAEVCKPLSNINMILHSSCWTCPSVFILSASCCWCVCVCVCERCVCERERYCLISAMDFGALLSCFMTSKCIGILYLCTLLFKYLGSVRWKKRN